MKSKKKSKKIRNAFVVAMMKRTKGGAMKNKKDKRKNGKNKQAELLSEYDE